MIWPFLRLSALWALLDPFTLPSYPACTRFILLIHVFESHALPEAFGYETPPSTLDESPPADRILN